MESTLYVDRPSTIRCHCWSVGMLKGLAMARANRREIDVYVLWHALGSA